ncbi:MAG: aconitate hydratase, partial [Candidatus Brocadiae bacterium]|nr:aconitate hydratase [Candidatus Brocadiia bacterium]
AKSFARIHRANLINFGIVPLTFADPDDHGRVGQGDRLVVEDVPAGLREGSLTVRDETGGFGFAVRADLSDREREIVLAGGRLNLIGQTSC